MDHRIREEESVGRAVERAVLVEASLQVAHEAPACRPVRPLEGGFWPAGEVNRPMRERLRHTIGREAHTPIVRGGVAALIVELDRLDHGAKIRVPLAEGTCGTRRQNSSGQNSTGAKICVPLAEGTFDLALREERTTRELIWICFLSGTARHATRLDEAVVHVRDTRKAVYLESLGIVVEALREHVRRVLRDERLAMKVVIFVLRALVSTLLDHPLLIFCREAVLGQEEGHERVALAAVAK